MSEKFERAKFWLDHGFALLPCQPNKKNLVTGFGPYRSKITDEKNVWVWWGKDQAANMAVLAPEAFYILDFDDLNIYAQWSKKNLLASQSYTETTPRGGKHVFLRGTPPGGVSLVKGAELKNVCIVSPSVVDGKPYKPVDIGAEILAVDPVQTLTSLSMMGHATPACLRADQIRQRVKNPWSHVEQIKHHYTVSHVLKVYKPDVFFYGSGDFKTCKCPFHKDSKPSFYVNDAIGVWGCHACNVRGDVINLYARLEGVSLPEAISRMWEVMA